MQGVGTSSPNSAAAAKMKELWEIGEKAKSELESAVASGGQEGPVDGPRTVNPKPYAFTLHPTPYTLHPTPYTLHPTPYTLHPTPCTLHPRPAHGAV